MKKIITLIMLLTAIWAEALAQVETCWISQGVVPGEKTFFYVFITNGQSVKFDPVPHIEGASAKFASSGYITMAGARNNTALYYGFEVTAYEPGTVTIPSLTIKANNGDIYHTTEQTLTVYPFSEIKWQPIPQTDGTLQYGVLWHIGNKTPYINQPVACELKIYTTPQIVRYQLPSIQKNGLAAQNFTPVFNTGKIEPMGTALVQGHDYNVMTFHSVYYPLRSGEISMSGEVIGNALDGSMDPRLAQLTYQYVSILLPIPEIKLTGKDFPPGAPQAFNNAVGEYSIKAETKTPDLSLNEPVIIEITIQGTGNIDALECPQPSDSEQWKLYPATKMGEAVRAPDGTSIVKFQQSMRPVREVGAIPSFHLSYFNPKTELYQTAATAPIPLPWKATTDLSPVGVPATQPPPAGLVPVAEMTDIYGLVPAEAMASLTAPASWKWYLLAYLPLIAMTGCYLLGRVREKRRRSAASRERFAAFKSIDTRQPSSQFLRTLGTFVETNIPVEYRDSSLDELLMQRDAHAFLPESSRTELSSAQRSAMMNSVKKALSRLPVILILAMLIPHIAGAAQAETSRAVTLYDKGEYTEALSAFTPDRGESRQRAFGYYGMGNSYYRLGDPGKAALSYRRALSIYPGFTEAQRNLDFIERKEGAILPPASSAIAWLTFVPRCWLLPLIIMSSALMLTCVAAWALYRKMAVTLAVTSVIAFMITVAGVINLAFYPVLPSSVDPRSLLVVTRAAEARHAADSLSPSIMTMPASTPLLLVAKRGSWYYALTFTGEPVWLESSHAEPVREQ